MKYLPPLLEHIWVSTLFLALTLAMLTLVRRRLTASALFTLALIGILKFAIPAGPLMDWALRLGEPSGSARIQLPDPAATVFRVSLPAAPGSAWPRIALAVWIATAFIVMLRSTLTRLRLVRLAVKTATPATPREIGALTRARARMRVRRSIDIIRSHVPESPAVLRIFRPLVVLPTVGCDALSDEELEALLCHECAHVRRNDNLIARVESIICALFWFHPLLWIARRITERERERACDEMVAQSPSERETYLTALSKFCHAAVAPPLPGVSCMATAGLKERMEHMEDYEDLRANSLSPRRIAAIAGGALFVYTVIAGIAGTGRALAVGTRAADAPFAIKLVAVRTGAFIELIGRVTDNATGTVLAAPTLNFQAGGEAEARSQNSTDDLDIVFRVRPGAASDPVVVDVSVKRAKRTYERSFRVTPSESAEVESAKYTGEPISMDLKDAELNDVLQILGKLAGFKVVAASAITGQVSVTWVGVPWDQALAEILRDHGLTYRIEGDTIYVTKR